MRVKKTSSGIVWPETIRYMEALCDLDMVWRDMKYDGQMSVSLDYPDRINLQVYGPFNNTIFFLSKDRDGFLLIADGERLTSEKEFEDRFGINLWELMDDLAMKGKKAGDVFIERANYKVIYRLGGEDDSICLYGREGRICLNFLEARFDREGSTDKGGNSPL